jgi:hypothetical protein
MSDKTNAERQRRYIAKLKAQAKASVSNATAGRDHAALAKELAQAKARNAELEGQLARLRKSAAAESTRKPVTKPANPDSEVARLKATILDLRRALRHFRTRDGGKIDSRSYTIIRSRMHPDRVSDPEKKARYKVAFEVFGELEKAVVDKDQLTLVREGWDAMQKKPKAKKQAKANSPKSLGRR